MSKGPGCDVPIHVIMLALYIELQLGGYSLTADHIHTNMVLVVLCCPGLV